MHKASVIRYRQKLVSYTGCVIYRICLAYRTFSPVYEVPAYEVPVYEVSVYEVPLYEVPVYEVLVYEVPVYEVPVYEVPEVPVYEVLVYKVPVYEANFVGIWGCLPDIRCTGFLL